MREILFRGKHMHVCPENKHLDGTWVEGYLEDENHINDGKCEFLIDPETICQYTGLTDKNGKKIFDGEVVRRETDYYGKHKVYDEPVVWEDDIEKGFLGEPYTSGYCIHGGNWEVIGSIHDGEGGNHA